METIVERLAEAMASMDGKFDGFHDPEDAGGYHEGYMVEAEDLIDRLRNRGLVVMEREA